MTLPKINNTPKYTITIPSTKREIRFRPFLVKEEKILLIAFESKDSNQILKAIVDTVIACIEEDINSKSLMPFDIEYLFLKIRSKSVGESINLSLNCSACGDANKVNIDIDSIKMVVPTIKDTIVISDNITLKMKWPQYGGIQKIPNASELSAIDQSLYLIASCLDSVLTADEVIKISDEPMQEVITFIEQLSSAQFAKVQEFVQSMPQLSHSIEFTCKCETHNKIDLRGLQDFF
jgi:hypothetical protein